MKLIIDLDNCIDSTEALRHIANALPVYLEKFPDDGNVICVAFAPNHELFIIYRTPAACFTSKDFLNVFPTRIDLQYDTMRWKWHES